MLKYIGIGMMIVGLALFIFTLLRGRQKGITSDMKELSMIISSGYVTERAPDEKKASPFEGKAPIKPMPKKKRVLSEEARGILEMVERDRENEAMASAQAKKKEEAIKEDPPIATPPEKMELIPPENEQKELAGLSSATMKGTAVLPEIKPDVAMKKGTAVLPEVKEKKGTAILQETPPKKGMAVLKEVLPSQVAAEPKEAPKKKGTAVLQEKDLSAPKENAKRGTAVLTEGRDNSVVNLRWQDPVPKKGTAVLDNASENNTRKGTAVLTDILATDKEVIKKGTAVLGEKGGNQNG